MKSTLDHLAIVAPDLDTGCAFVSRALGVELQPGGAHPRMGTHNRLLRLGADIYLEVIAIDPSAQRPDRPRWFGMDDLAVDTPPRLATWVARTDDIHAMSEACRAIVGDPEPMTRGTLAWQITIPADGSLPLNGSAPTLIQWAQTPHPASAMLDRGCELVALDVFDPDPAKVQALLTAINFSGPVHLHALDATAKPYLIAHIQTPSGLKKLPYTNRSIF
ncbi:VOC family protein [Pseudomonas sp. ADAK2]|uniref:VOC family protein n=1 Tax=unclassified Pseudomonas TaxID=196821 RepID=UPI001463050B|nr:MULTISPECIES: VOC family protein [unclassified Pseudomonas]QJI39569.1 VOC family protein [Pseudomonas sp. ADAK7]QJI45875.1 VOC family protein [Pseudomonas sp. ADAK2]